MATKYVTERCVMQMQIVKHSRKALCFILALTLFCGAVAFAVSYEGLHDGDTVDNVTYDWYGILYRDGPQNFRASVWCQANSTVPANYIGCQAQLLDGYTGEVIRETSVKHNSNPSNFHYAVTSGGYYAYSAMAGGFVYLGADEVEKRVIPTSAFGGNSVVSPANQAKAKKALLSTLNADMTYPTNEKGESYGSILLADVVGAYPDLIAAVGVNGIKGYIRFEEVHPTFNSEADIKEYELALESDNTVPLYDSQGKVIGVFELDVLDDDIPAGIDTSNIEAVKAALEEGSGK